MKRRCLLFYFSLVLLGFVSVFWLRSWSATLKPALETTTPPLPSCCRRLPGETAALAGAPELRAATKHSAFNSTPGGGTQPRLSFRFLIVLHNKKNPIYFYTTFFVLFVLIVLLGSWSPISWNQNENITSRLHDGLLDGCERPRCRRSQFVSFKHTFTPFLSPSPRQGDI